MTRVAQLLERARRANGLDDFGDDDFREGLEILIESADREACLTSMGTAAFDAQIVDHLSNRLQVEDWYRRHPEIDEQEIIAPLIGLGLPRTGSTALSCLLAEDAGARFIRNWEAIAPCPPPDLSMQDIDPRIARAEAAMERRSVMFPRARQMLPSTATGPTECQTFMAMDFKSQLFQAFAHIPTYIDWLNHVADMVSSYTYVKRILKLLQWRCPPTRWRLKNPSNSLFIDALDTVFSDARFWMTHRDVAQVIPSVADLYFEYGSAFSDDVDKHWLGAMTTGFCELGMKRMIAFRDAGNDERFFDIHFAPFQADPFPVLEALYAWLSEDLTDVTRARMQAWRESNARDKHGSHRLDPADFGIDLVVLRERFGFYADRFGVS
jgi:Sulfotransferase family